MKRTSSSDWWFSKIFLSSDSKKFSLIHLAFHRSSKITRREPLPLGMGMSRAPLSVKIVLPFSSQPELLQAPGF
jgi:hypothetical protein